MPAPAQEEEQEGQDKSDKLPGSLERSALSSREDLDRDFRAQNEEEEPTPSFGELRQLTQQEQQPPPEETCLSSSGADLPSRQPDPCPSQDPFETAQSVGLSEIPESSSLRGAEHHQPHLLGKAGSPKLQHDLDQGEPPLAFLKHATQ